MLFYILSFLDIFASVVLLTIPRWSMKVTLLLGLILLFKGLFLSILPNIEDGAFIVEWMGWIDIIAAALLMLRIEVIYLAVLPMLKGIYSIGLCYLSSNPTEFS